MALKDDWKKTGVGLGHAFKGFGKNVVRSVRTGVDKLDDKVEGNKEGAEQKDTSTVFNDGSWRNTGKELGSAFKGLGQTIVGTAKTGVDHVDDAVNGDKNTPSDTGDQNS